MGPTKRSSKRHGTKVKEQLRVPGNERDDDTRKSVKPIVDDLLDPSASSFTSGQNGTGDNQQGTAPSSGQLGQLDSNNQQGSSAATPQSGATGDHQDTKVTGSLIRDSDLISLASSSAPGAETAGGKGNEAEAGKGRAAAEQQPSGIQHQASGIPHQPAGMTREQTTVSIDKREQQVKELLFYQSENERLDDQIAGIERQIKEAKMRMMQGPGGEPQVVTAKSTKYDTIPEENRHMRREVVKRQRELNILRKKWHVESDKHKRGAYDGTVPGQVEAAVKLLLREPPKLADVQAKAEEEAVKRAQEEAAKLAEEEE